MSKPRGGRPRRSTTAAGDRPVTDEAALLASIAADPLDDAPRLVYADWLDENGQPAKAEYVRLVVRLRAAPDDPAAVARVVGLAADLDADWRQTVGGVFEVAVEAPGPLRIGLLALAWALRLGNPSGLVSPADGPVVLRSGMTREEAEEMVEATRVGGFEERFPVVVKFYVRAMRAGAETDRPA